MVTTLAELGVSANGHRNVKAQCPQCGRAGQRTHPRDKSLSVDTERGLFRCHYCGFKGKVGAFGSVSDWRPKVFSKPAPKPEAVSPFSDRARLFWSERKISEAALERFGVYEDGGTIKFPYIRGGDLVNIKSRWRNRDGSKGFKLEEGCELIFFGMDQVDGFGQLAIVEGEMDALAMATAGIPNVISVPNGASTGEMTWLASAQALLDGQHTIVLGVDGDGPGQLLEAEIARRVGKSKCCRMRWPEGCKDANDVLMQHGPEELRRCYYMAEDYPVDGAHWFNEYTDDALRMRSFQRQRGATTGWVGLDEFYTVAKNELTIVTGVPGSGKSEWLDAMLINLARREGWVFALYSPENAPGEEHFSKLAQKFHGKPFWPGATPEMTDDEIRAFGEWSGQHFLSLDLEMPTIETLLAVLRGFVLRKGIRGVVIDPWNRIDRSRPNGVSITEYVNQCLGLLSGFAKRNDVHVWLVAHPRIMRKEDGKVPVPTPYDISDSAHFFNMADNCIAINRDKTNPELPVEVHVQKVRFQRVGQVGTAFLHYDRVTGRYREV